MRYRPEPGALDQATILARRRGEIRAEYSFHRLDLIKIGGEPISLELALLLGLIIDNAQPAQEAAAE